MTQEPRRAASRWEAGFPVAWSSAAAAVMGEIVHLKYGLLPKAGTLWSIQDDRDLLDLDAQRFTLAVVVQTLGRTPDEIARRLQELKSEVESDALRSRRWPR